MDGTSPIPIVNPSGSIQQAPNLPLNDSQNQKGSTEFTLAAKKGNFKEVERLLQTGVDVNSQDEDGDSALIYLCNICDQSCSLSTEEIIKNLLERGANPNLQNKNGFTALMNASTYGIVRIVKILIGSGADPNLKTKKEVTALMLAYHSVNENTMKILFDHGADRTGMSRLGTRKWNQEVGSDTIKFPPSKSVNLRLL